MFTGIVEEIGSVSSFSKNSTGGFLDISASKVLSNATLGDSIAVNGVCLTIDKFTTSGFSAHVMNTSLDSTNLGLLKAGSLLNLERALTLNKPLGGHIVTGHVDFCSKLLKKSNSGFSTIFELECPNDFLKFLVQKGSVTLNGTSLTISNLKSNSFEVSLIPHTLESTILNSISLGDYVNVETDILGKYVDRLLSFKETSSKSKIDLDFLKSNGFF